MGLRVSDLVAPAGTTFLTSEEESVVAVVQPQMAVELEEEAAEVEEGAEGAAAEGEEGAEGGAAEGEGEGAGAEESSEG
jgi:large subunit ribosomal protein L25